MHMCEVCVCVWLLLCLGVSVCVCMHACMHVHAWAYASVHIVRVCQGISGMYARAPDPSPLSFLKRPATRGAMH